MQAEGDSDRHAVLTREAFNIGYKQGTLQRALGDQPTDPEVESFLVRINARKHFTMPQVLTLITTEIIALYSRFLSATAATIAMRCYQMLTRQNMRH